MNLEIDKIFSEIGRLHMQLIMLQEELAKVKAEFAEKSNTVTT